MRKISLILGTVLGMVLISQFVQAWDQKPPVVKNVTLLHVGKLLAVPGKPPITEQTIVIEGKRIKDIQPGYITKKDLNIPYAKVIDLKDKFVMPGLIDVHVHLTMVRGEALGADDGAFAGVINAKKTLMAGYTTVRDNGARDDTIFKLRDKIKKGEIEGPRIFAAGQIIGVGTGIYDLECHGRESCRRTTRDLINRGADWIKIYASCSGGKFCSHKDGAGMFFDDELEAVIAVAKKYDIKVAAHSHPRDSALQLLKFDISSIEHGSFLNDKAMKAMKKKDVYYVPTLAVHDFLEKLKRDGKVKGRFLAHIDTFLKFQPEIILKAYKLGVKLATGSDSGEFPHGRNYREIERLVDLGITPMDALMMATVNGADLLDMSAEIGTIEAGKFADIIALSGDPLDDITNIEKVIFVMKEGRVYKK